MNPSQSDPAPPPAKVYFPSPKHPDIGVFSKKYLLSEALTLSKRICKWRRAQQWRQKDVRTTIWRLGV